MSKSVFIPLLLILALGTFFRFYLLTEYPLGLYPDEAMNGNNALEALATGDFKVFYPENNGREGFFINIQALSLWVFGNEPWALRLVSAIFGTLTILGVYLLTRELFYQPPQMQNLKIKNQNDNSKFKIPNTQIIPLLSSFFLATSFWHLNFSRIGFRAITVPFFSTFAIYFLLKGLRTGKISSLVLAGISTGLGLQTYIAFRFMPFVLAVPILGYLWRWFKENQNDNSKFKINTTCAPCAVLLFIFVAFVVALPMGYYFFQSPQDFLGRSGQVSIFSAESPLGEFVKSNIATLGMFFWQGDCNWRHNFNCQPQLHFLVAFFFVAGFITVIRGLFKNWKIKNLTLAMWFLFMMFPATLTREGLPHALRSIGLIPPVMILAGLGAWRLYAQVMGWFEKQKEKWPARVAQIRRIERELTAASIVVLLLIPLATYTTYFIKWSQNPHTYSAFSTDLWHLGKYLNTIPEDIKKYVVVNLSGVEVRGIPMSAQTVMFATDSFRKEERRKKNIVYLLPKDIKSMALDPKERTLVTLLLGKDRELINFFQEKNPEFRAWTPGDFVILQNY